MGVKCFSVRQKDCKGSFKAIKMDLVTEHYCILIGSEWGKQGGNLHNNSGQANKLDVSQNLYTCIVFLGEREVIFFFTLAKLVNPWSRER